MANENLIPIPGRLHSVATEGHVAGADEIIDDNLSKDQQTINAEVNAALGEGGTVDEKIAGAIDNALENVAFIDDSESSPAVVPGFDPTTDTVHVTAQTLSESQKAQVRTNIGLGDVDARISNAVASEASQRAAADSSLQGNINAKADKATTLAGYGITDAYTKSETYTKTEVNGLVDTPHQEYVTVDTYASLPETGSKDTIYRVSNYNGSTSQVDASVYSEYAWNGSQYIFLCVKSQIGEVFDISVYHDNAKYADLTAALNGGANIPQSLQKGGMSIKFVQSSDNKYVQYRLMSDTFNTNVDNWQGVDNVPTAGSDNLVKSGGAFLAIQESKEGDNSLLFKKRNISTPFYYFPIELVKKNTQYYIQCTLLSGSGNRIVFCIANKTSHSITSLIGQFDISSPFKIDIPNYTDEQQVCAYFNDGTTFTWDIKFEQYGIINAEQQNRLEIFNKDVLFINKLTIPVVAGQAIVRGNTFQELLNGVNGKTCYFKIISGRELLGNGNIFIDCRTESDKSWSSFGVFSGNVASVAFTNNFDKWSISAEAANVVGTGNVTLECYSEKIYTLDKNIEDLQKASENLAINLQDITGIEVIVDAVQGEEIVYQDNAKDCVLKTGQTIEVKLEEGNEFLADDVIYLYFRRVDNGAWNALQYLRAISRTEITITLEGDYDKFSIATSATNVIGSGVVNVLIKGALTDIKSDIRDIKSLANNYNNVSYNQLAVSDFLLKYKRTIVDSFNQLNIALAGDSIFGRLEGTELPYTPDTNNPSETQYGYQTGHYPPNMWAQNVAYKLLQFLQYKHADVKYFNYAASEVTKIGTWTDITNTADGIRLTYCSTQGNAIVLSFSGATHCKFIWSDFVAFTRGAQLKVTISTDNGSTWKTPSELSLTEKIPSDNNEGNGIYTLDYTGKFKYGNQIWKGFNKNVSYMIKIENNTAHYIAAWGFETWSNPRINVIVTAEGGNTATGQYNNPERFYSSMYDQDLVVYELPVLNDLGQGVITDTYYKGVATTSLTPVTTSQVDAFYYVNVDGIYNNFATGLKAYSGDCIQWNGTSWEIGSNYLDAILATYLEKNKEVLERLSMNGVPLLTLITHPYSGQDNSRPFMTKIGLVILRDLVKKFGFGNIDVYTYYKEEMNGASIWADGTHLNSTGVKMYVDLISEVVTILNDSVGQAYPRNTNMPLIGEADTDIVTFGFEFKNVPTVMLLNTNSRVITNVTKNGFETSGSGSYKYKVEI